MNCARIREKKPRGRIPWSVGKSRQNALLPPLALCVLMLMLMLLDRRRCILRPTPRCFPLCRRRRGMGIVVLPGLLLRCIPAICPPANVGECEPGQCEARPKQACFDVARILGWKFDKQRRKRWVHWCCKGGERGKHLTLQLPRRIRFAGHNRHLPPILSLRGGSPHDPRDPQPSKPWRTPAASKCSRKGTFPWIQLHRLRLVF